VSDDDGSATLPSAVFFMAECVCRRVYTQTGKKQYFILSIVKTKESIFEPDYKSEAVSQSEKIDSFVF
jgi:hypothetical protein